MDIQIRVCTQMADVDGQAWDSLLCWGDPSLRHAWLRALQETGPATPDRGWQLHMLVAEHEGEIVGALPAWWKAHSLGEFVYDWSWAEFCGSVGRPYYPKLVVGVPFTPITGRRILRAASLEPAQADRVGAALLERAQREVRARGGSGIHVLFPTCDEVDLAVRSGWFARVQTQARFRNLGYADFDAFLATLRSRRRKEIRRERRQVRDAGVRVEVVRGDAADADLREAMWRWYGATVDQFAWGHRHLTRAFLDRVFEEMGEDIVLFVARDAAGQAIAGTFNLRSATALHGRYWGTDVAVSCLHFEVCYYAMVEFAIQEGLHEVGFGHGGEHKEARGFPPELTWSAHWMVEPRIGEILADFCARERAVVESQIPGHDDQTGISAS